MGGDGGTKAVSRRFIQGAKGETKKKEIDSSTKDQRKIDRATLCTLSSKPLEEPVVADKLGFLYNKQEIVEALLHKTLVDNQDFKHIKRLKDLKECIMTRSSTNPKKFVCPVTGIDLNGQNPFVLLNSGKVVSYKAVKEIPTLLDGEESFSFQATPHDEHVLAPNTKSTNNKFLKLFPNEEEARVLRGRLLAGENKQSTIPKRKHSKKEIIDNYRVKNVIKKAKHEVEA